MSITTRPALPQDIPTLLEFEQGIITFERPFNPTLKPDPISYYDVAAMVNDPNIEVVVALEGEQIIASGYARKLKASDYVTPSEYAFLGFMFVEPSYRGRGVNKLIMDDLLAWAREQGLTEIRLQVYADNAGAIRAYEKVGFEGLLLEMRKSI